MKVSKQFAYRARRRPYAMHTDKFIGSNPAKLQINENFGALESFGNVRLMLKVEIQIWDFARSSMPESIVTRNLLYEFIGELDFLNLIEINRD